jgi:hypothetical protein
MDGWLDLIKLAGGITGTAVLLWVLGSLMTGKLMLPREIDPWRTAVEDRDERIRTLESEAKQLALDTKNETARQAELSRGETAELRKTVNELVAALTRQGHG